MQNEQHTISQIIIQQSTCELSQISVWYLNYVDNVRNEMKKKVIIIQHDYIDGKRRKTKSGKIKCYKRSQLCIIYTLPVCI